MNELMNALSGSNKILPSSRMDAGVLGSRSYDCGIGAGNLESTENRETGHQGSWIWDPRATELCVSYGWDLSSVTEDV